MKAAVVIDESEHSHVAVTLLARIPFPDTPRVTLLSTIEEQPPFRGEDPIANEAERQALEELRGHMRARADAQAEREAERLRRNGWEVRTDAHRVGCAWREIVDDLGALHVDLVALGALPPGTPARFLLATVPKKILRAAPCSVLLARTKTAGIAEEEPAQDSIPAEPLKLLLAYDGSESARQAVTALAAIPWGDRAEITVVTVLTVATTMFRRDLLERMSNTWQAHRKQAESELESVTEELRRSATVVNADLIDGGVDPTEEILQAAQVLDTDVIVAGHSGKSVLKEMLLGSVTAQLAEYAPCSVWVVRPPSIERD